MKEYFKIEIDVEKLSSVFAKKVIEMLDEQATSPPQINERKRIDGIRGLANHIRCSVSKAQDLKNKGKIPFYEVGKRVFFYSDEIDEALKYKGSDS
ncbi:DUF3853 family protein [Parabacteroides segnis]|uniref:DUF3853 family protein n=1 Tax=Parabacteroides segnis TaxID=2763058 RepID=UPI003511CA63